MLASLVALLSVLVSAAAAQEPGPRPAPAAPAPSRAAFDGVLTCVLQVRDLDAAVAWYADVLGLPLWWKDDAIGFAEVKTATGDVALGLARHDEPSVAPGVVLTFGVLDVEAAEAALRAKQVKTMPITTYPGLVKLLLFQDRDGNTLQLAQSLQPAPPAHAGLEAVAFLAGSWVREEGERREEEHWMAPSGGLMLGMARTTQAGKATFFEHLRIEKAAAGVVYHVSLAGRPPVAFTLDSARSGRNRAVFVNPEHDFPTQVSYWLAEDGRLHARIEGERDGKKRAHDFVWQRGGLR
jgi:predicted enzyme related to lactoylglutathione lyase